MDLIKLSEYIPRLRTGDRSLVPLIIESYIPMTNKIAKYYQRIHPHKADDIISSAYMGLTQAVVWASEGRMYDNNIEPYIAKTVRRFIMDFLEHDHLIRIPRAAFRDMIQKMDIVEFLPIAYPLSIQDNDEENGPEAHIIEPEARQDTDPVDYSELLSKLALTEFETTVLTHKSEGRTLHEIAELVGKSHVWVYKTLEHIRERADYLRLKQKVE